MVWSKGALLINGEHTGLCASWNLFWLEEDESGTIR